MLEKLLTEQRNQASSAIDTVSTEQMLRIINEEDAKVAAAVAREIPSIAKAVDAAVERVRSGGRLFCIGAGTSGRLGVLEASECPPTFNVPPEMVQAIIAGGEHALARASEASEDDPGAGARDLYARGFTSADTLVGISASGRTPYVMGAVLRANGLEALTIGVSCTPDSEIGRAAVISIQPITGPEVLTGSTRLKAGTATKLVLNMLTTGMMIRLGHTFGNLMVNVQPKNIKLEDRARRIVAEAGGIDAASAERLFEESGRNVKTAILIARLGVTRAQAESLLRQSGGRLAEALRG
jgi:N-acetylmuramic acid 6-phosphate etherase